MKLAFIHTAEKVKVDSRNNFYTDGAYDKTVWPRYIRLCDNMVFVARRDPRIYDDDVLKEKYNIIDTNQIEVVLIEDTRESLRDFINIKKRAANRSKIKRVIQRTDKVIVRLPCAEGVSAIRIAQRSGLDYLIECVGCAWDSLWNYNLKGKALALPSYLLMRWVVYRANFVLYVTNDFLQKRYPTHGRTTTCSNVVLRRTSNGVLNERRAKLLGSNGGQLIIGTLAAIDVPYKGHDDVIKALANLRKRGHKFHYQMAGAGSQERLFALAQDVAMDDSIEFLGALKHEDVFKWLDSIDLYIQPSKQEGIPRALLEAMSRACPALGSNAGGIPEALHSDFIFRKGDLDAIEDKLVKISNTRIMLGQAERNFAKSKEYQNDILTKRRNDFFDTFVAHEKGRD